MTNKCPIAVVGVSALFPGSPQLTGFWKDILRGKDQIREIPESYWLIDDYFNDNQKAEDKTYGKRGAFVDPVIFDCIDHGILPAQVQDIDTVQLMALVVAQSVLRDAADGDFEHLDRSRMSVILGVAGGTEQLVQMGSRLQRPVWLKSLREAGIEEEKAQAICQQIADHYVPWSEASFPGLLGNVVAGRIANRFNLGGTNCVVDAACASSSSALSMAVNELYLGNSDCVIAGGADALNDILMYMCFSKTPALSPTGDCRPFSDKADGTILGEGVGMLALRRLDDAERDSDTIYAVIKGVGSSSDGSGTAVYAPVSEGQAQAITRAYKDTDFTANSIGLIEAHGTGTKAGDKAEFNGLQIAFSDKKIEGDSGGHGDGDGAAPSDEQSSINKQWCALGSVKSQIGHTKGAAGAASLIKAVLALHHKVLPPTIKVDKPNPAFEIEKSPFYINTRLRPWISPTGLPRRAGVSSFGFGGSNFHVAVEEYTQPQENPKRIMASEYHLLAFSAESVDALFNQTESLLSNLPDDEDALEFIARHSQTQFNASDNYRLTLVVNSLQNAHSTLESAQTAISNNTATSQSSSSGWHYGVGKQTGKVACLFPGQGSQYLNMGSALATQFSTLQQAWDASESQFINAHPNSQSLAATVFPPPVFSNAEKAQQTQTLNQTQWAQPAIGATSLAVWQLLSSLGLQADAFAGHSFGEITALHAAGVLSAKDVIRVALTRGELMRKAAEDTEGAMTAVAAPRKEVEAILKNCSGILNIANVNSPKQTVVSGELDAIANFEDACRSAELRFTRLPVSTAFHSPIVADAVEPFSEFLNDVRFSKATAITYANSSAKPYPKTANKQREVLAQQLASPVLFAEQIENLYADGVRTFIEVGPGNVLTNLVGDCLNGRAHNAIATDKKSDASLRPFWLAIAQLLAVGLPLNLALLWQEFRPVTPPQERPTPKLGVPITGINYNRRYPPKEGASALPKPNPKPAASPIHSGDIKNTEPKPSRVTTMSEKPATAHTPIQTPSPASAPTSNSTAVTNEWLAAFESIQRQTNETHRQYLQMSQQALAQLGQMAGLPNTYTVPVTAPLNQTQPLSQPSLSQSSMQPQPMYQQAPVAAAAPASSFTPPPAPTSTSTPIPTSEINAPNVAQASPAANNINIAQVMLDVVSEKTGYPREMLELSMSLENDLGIDSIKRVEILSATLELVPDLPEANPSDMASLQTLQEVVDFIREQTGATANSVQPTASDSNPQPNTNTTSNINITEQLLTIVADKTGYPLEMLEPSMDLENDLGIDSIKRVEILSATTEQVPNLPEFDATDMASLATLAEIIRYIEDKLGDSPSETTAEDIAESISAKKPETESAADYSGLTRYRLALHKSSLPGLTPIQLSQQIVVMPSDSALAQPLCEQLQALGYAATTTDQLNDDCKAVISLHGLQLFSGIDSAIEANREVFSLATKLAPRLEKSAGVFIALQNTGGDYGLETDSHQSDNAPYQAWSGGMSGLIKTAAQEWPMSLVRSIDFAFTPIASNEDLTEAAARLAREIIFGGIQREVAINGNGQRLTPISEPSDGQSLKLPLSENDVLIVTGGARGVTASSIIELCRALPLRVILLGRTPLGDVKHLDHCTTESEIMQQLLRDAKARSETPKPADLKRQVQQVLAVREIHTTLATIETTGSHVSYQVCDINNQTELDDCLQSVRDTHGRIDGLIHGAGVLADKLLSSKSLMHFDQVFGTKVNGLRSLLDAMQQDALKLLCLFSSVAARTGNIGQSDYAMANEVLNRIAASYQASHPKCKAVAINWGPWESGMVDDALKRKFETLGVSLIPLTAGAQFFVKEISQSAIDTEVVYGGMPLNRPLANPHQLNSFQFIIHANLEDLPHLDSHRVRGNIVLPVVQVVDWFRKAISNVIPSNASLIIDQLSVLKGVVFSENLTTPETFQVVVTELEAPGHFELLLLDSQQSKRYSAKAHYVSSANATQTQYVIEPAIDFVNIKSDAFTDQPYDVLFHGPMYQSIAALTHISAEHASAQLHGAQCLHWSVDKGSIDQAALDGALQLALLWGEKLLNKQSLPMGFDRLILLHDGPLQGPLSCVLTGSTKDSATTLSDIWLIDSGKNVVACIQGLRMFAVQESLR